MIKLPAQKHELQKVIIMGTHSNCQICFCGLTKELNFTCTLQTRWYDLPIVIYVCSKGLGWGLGCVFGLGSDILKACPAWNFTFITN